MINVFGTSRGTDTCSAQHYFQIYYALATQDSKGCLSASTTASLAAFSRGLQETDGELCASQGRIGDTVEAFEKKENL